MFPLQLRNLDKVARHVKVTHEESPYFSLSCQKLAGSKVAPGMEITYQITFTPDEKKVQMQLVFIINARYICIVNCHTYVLIVIIHTPLCRTMNMSWCVSQSVKSS